jgi:hypothetical protein
MDDSAREAAPSATEKPDDEDNEDEDADIVKDGQASTIRTVLEPFCTRGGKIVGNTEVARINGLFCSQPAQQKITLISNRSTHPDSE